MARKKGRKRFDPTARSGYPSRAAFRREIRQRARSQIEPALNDISQRRREARGAHSARDEELQRWYGFDKAARESALAGFQDSSNALLSRQDVLGDQSQAGLSAALRQVQEGAQVEASRLGVAAPGMDPAMAAALASYAKNNQMGLAGDVAGGLQTAAGHIGTSGVEARTAGTDEARRFKGLLEGLTKERSDVRGRLPELMKQVRAEMMAEQLGIKQQELAEDQFGETKKMGRSQRRIAGRQQDLAEDQFGEEQDQNAFNRKMQRGQLKLQRGELKLRRRELRAAVQDATTKEGRERAKAAAKRFDSAVEWVNGYLAPNDQDKGRGGNFRQDLYEQNRDFGTAWRAMQTQFGMGKLESLRVLMAAPNSGWQKHANKLYWRIKANRRREQIGAAGPPTPTS